MSKKNIDFLKIMNSIDTLENFFYRIIKQLILVQKTVIRFL